MGSVCCEAIVPSFGNLWGTWRFRPANSHFPSFECAENVSVCFCSHQYNSRQIRRKGWVRLHLLCGLFPRPEPESLLRVRAEVHSRRQLVCREGQPDPVRWAKRTRWAPPRHLHSNWRSFTRLNEKRKTTLGRLLSWIFRCQTSLRILKEMQLPFWEVSPAAYGNVPV